MSDEIKIPLDQIQSLEMTIGDCCHVRSRTTSDGCRVLTITRPDGVICVFSGDMKFTWVMPPNEVA